MPSALTAYVAGVASVGAALLVGFGGALLLSNTVMTEKPAGPSRIERVTKADPEPPAQSAVSPTVFPAQASPVVVGPNTASELNQARSLTTVGTELERENRSDPAPLGVAPTELVRHAHEERRTAPKAKSAERHARRAQISRGRAAKRSEDQRSASNRAAVPSKTAIHEAPLDTEDEDDGFERMAPSRGRLGLFEE